MSEIFDMVHMSQVGNLAEVSRDFRDLISRANTKVTASMSTMFYCGSSGRRGIVDMLAVTFVFKTSGFPPFVLLTGLCHEIHVIPLLDFRLGSYEPYQWRKSAEIIGGDETEPSKVAHIKKRIVA